MKRHNNKKKKPAIGQKGELFFDEAVNRKLLHTPTQELGFKVVFLPPSLRNNGITDLAIKEHAKGRPIVTDDSTAYKEAGSEIDTTTYIHTASVPKDEGAGYVVQWVEFLKQHTTNTLKRQKKWEVPFKKKK